jgi:cysteine desulfurase
MECGAESKAFMEEIYLDNHTATRPFSSCLDQMTLCMKNYWASTSSPHRLGQRSHFPLSASLAKIYELLGAKDQDSFFCTSNGAMAVSEVFLSTYLSFVKETGRTLFLSTDLEEAPFLHCLKRMETFGCSGKTLKVNHFGQLTGQLLAEQLRPRSALLSISWANGLTGVVHPLQDLASICKEKGVLLHVDVSTCIGKQFFRFEDLSADFMTFDGSMIHAPYGHAAVFVKSGVNFSDLSQGSSSESTSSVIMLAEAVENASQQFDHVCTEIARLRDRLESNLHKALPQIVFPFKEADRLPNVSVVCFPGVMNEAMLYLLNARGVYATTGGGKYQKLSHVLKLCQIDPILALGAVSFSLSYETTQEQIDKASNMIIDAYHQLLQCSEYMINEEKEDV